MPEAACRLRAPALLKLQELRPQFTGLPNSQNCGFSGKRGAPRAYGVNFVSTCFMIYSFRSRP